MAVAVSLRSPCRTPAKVRQLRTRDEQTELLSRIESFGARLARPSTGLSDEVARPTAVSTSAVLVWGAKISVLPANGDFSGARTDFWHPTGIT
jgi:hypothetical protein